MAEHSFKLASFVGDQPVRYAHPPHFRIDVEQSRLILGAWHSPVESFLSIVEEMTGPFCAVFVLIEAVDSLAEGRYRLCNLSFVKVANLCREHRSLFQGFASQNLRIVGQGQNCWAEYNRHECFVVSGVVETTLKKFEAKGWKAGELELPFPHIHGNEEPFFPLVRTLIDAYDWAYSPLEAGDDD